jgi:hypothetical protein
MNPRKFLKFALSLFLPLAATAGTERTNSVPAASGEMGAAHDVRFYLSFEKTTFTNSEPIVAWCVLSNMTESPLSVPTFGMGIGLEFVVTNSNNLPVAQVDNEFRGELTTAGIYSIPLPPHHSHSNSVEIHRLYRLKEGVYRICAKREMAFELPLKKSILSSDVVTITVTNQ